MKTRREFIQQAGGTCLLLAGGGLLLNCGTTANLPAFEGDEITIPVSSFNDKPFVIVKSEKKGNVMVRKKEDGTYHAFSLVCTHRKGKVVEKNGALKCTKHGSQFTIDGQVTDGPADTNLEKFETSVQGDNVVVKI